MARTKSEDMPANVRAKYEEYQEARLAEKNKSRIQDAKDVLTELESEYEHAKEVFFKVNGARRILKNQD